MDLNNALKIVKENGYIVIKPTNRQFEDVTQCEECDGDYDCFYCSCKICIFGGIGELI